MKTTLPEITKPQNFTYLGGLTAPCGCVIRFDNDGFIRMSQCNLHDAAPELLGALRLIAQYPKNHHLTDGGDASHRQMAGIAQAAIDRINGIRHPSNLAPEL